MGGVVAHKGYALGLVVELLGGTLSGEGCADGSRTMRSNGVLFTVYNIEHFTELSTYYEEVEALLRHVKSSRLAPGFKEILARESRSFAARSAKRSEGIEIDETTWAAICQEGRTLGLDPNSW